MRRQPASRNGAGGAREGAARIRALAGRLTRAIEGVALMEFAFCAPIFLLMLLGTYDFGRAMLDQAKLTAVVRAGAEYGAVNSGATESEIEAAALTGAGTADAGTTVSASKFCGCSSGTAVSCSSTCSDGTSPANYVTVVANDQVDLSLSYPMMPNPLQLTRSLTIRVP